LLIAHARWQTSAVNFYTWLLDANILMYELWHCLRQYGQSENVSVIPVIKMTVLSTICSWQIP